MLRDRLEKLEWQLAERCKTELSSQPMATGMLVHILVVCTMECSIHTCSCKL